VELEQLEQAAHDAPDDLDVLEQYCRAWEAAGNDYAGRAAVADWIADFHGQESGWPLRQIAGLGLKAVPALSRALGDAQVCYGALMCLRLLGERAVAATPAVHACLSQIEAGREYEIGVALEALCAMGRDEVAPIVGDAERAADMQFFLRGLLRTVDMQQLTPAGSLAISALARLAVDQPAATPLLRELYLHGAPEIARQVLTTVASVGRPTAEMLRLVVRGLRDKRDGVAAATRSALARDCAERPETLQGVIDALRQGWMSSAQATPFVWEQERNARTTIPTLLKAVAEEAPEDRQAAAAQLQKLLLDARPRREALEAQLEMPDRVRHARSNLDKLDRQLKGVEQALRVYHGF